MGTKINKHIVVYMLFEELVLECTKVIHSISVFWDKKKNYWPHLGVLLQKNIELNTIWLCSGVFSVIQEAEGMLSCFITDVYRIKNMFFFTHPELDLVTLHALNIVKPVTF